MGLDIYFHRAKRTDYDAYTKAQEEWQSQKPAVYKMSDTEYEALDAEAKAKAEKEVKDWYDKQPKLENEDIGYFRKVNFLMPLLYWKGEPDRNCEYVEQSRADLEDLLERCNAVLTTPKKHRVEKAQDLLATESGFFFGSTEYDDYYFKDVEEVRDWVSSVLDDFDEEEDVILMYCWY